MGLKYSLPYDIYERHQKVGSFIKDSDTVLDVGGELDHLAKFCHPQKIIVANLTTGDVIIPGDRLPFKNNSYSVVCAIDVLEHIEKPKRQKFIEELARVASHIVILSFPIGTKKHVQFEKEIQTWLSSIGHQVIYLAEHIKYGLPTPEEVSNLTKNFNSQIAYSGNLQLNKFLFRVFLFDPKIKFVRKLVSKLKAAFNFLTNPIFYAILSNKSYSENVVRAYVIIEKK